MKMKDIVILTHGDIDGIASAAILLRYLRIKMNVKNENIELIFTGPLALPEKLKKLINSNVKTIYITDISINIKNSENTKGIIKKLNSEGKRIIWIDHHQWSIEDINEIMKSVELIIVEKTLSAARIVYEKFMKEDDISRKIAEYADDIDALIDKFNESFILRALSFKNGWKEKLIMKFSNGIFWDEEISREAEKVKRITERDINEAHKKTKIYETKSGLKFGLIDLRWAETPKSWLAKRISEKFNLDFTIVWRRDDAISLYIGNKSKNINLLKIAEEFSGGGHPFACGFRMKLSWKSKIINYLTLKRKILKEVEDVVKRTIELM